MVSIFLRSLVYNVLFYALLVFWILTAVPTYLMSPSAFIAVASLSRQYGHFSQVARGLTLSQAGHAIG